jgi:hypothetical protein
MACICIVAGSPPNIVVPHPATIARRSLYGTPVWGVMQIGETSELNFNASVNLISPTSKSLDFALNLLINSRSRASVKRANLYYQQSISLSLIQTFRLSSFLIDCLAIY